MSTDIVERLERNIGFSDGTTGVMLIADIREAAATIRELRKQCEGVVSVDALLAWIKAAWPALSASDFNQGVVRGFEIIEAQLKEGHIQRFCADYRAIAGKES